MPTKEARNHGVRGRPRTSEGKKQMLLIISVDLVKALKIAAIEDGRPASHIAEEAMRAWLDKRKEQKS